MADSDVGNPPLTRAVLREEFDRFRDEMFRYGATKADVTDRKTCFVGVSLVVAPKALETAGDIVVAVFTR